MATVAIYVRVSTEEQAQRGHSLQEQEAVCRSYAAERLGCQEPIVIREEGVSGGILERPGIERLVAIAGSVEYVICKDPDRLARNLGHQLLLTERIERQGARLVFVDFERSPTPEGRLFYAIRGAVAEFERAKITQRTLEGKIRKAKEGGIPTRVNAYGYRQNGHLEVDPVEAEVVRQIYDWFLHGLDGHPPPVPPGVIARHLNRLGIPTKMPGGKWNQATVRRLLLSPRYAGRWYFRVEDAAATVGNRFRPPEQRVRRRRRPPSEWVEVEVPAIIAPEVWEQAQRAYRLGSAVRAGRAPHRCYLLTGLAVCGLCGRSVVGTSRANADGSRKRYYVCQLRHQTRGCTLPYAPAGEAEESVWQVVRGWIESPETLRAYLEGEATREAAGERRKEVEKALGSLREERRRLLRLYQKGLAPVEELEQAMEGLRNEEAILMARLAEAARQRWPAVASVEDLAAHLRPLLGVLTPEIRREVLQRIVDLVAFLGKEQDGSYRLQIVPRP